MINPLDPEILEIRSRFLQKIRGFFFKRGYLEVTTPLMNPTPAFEPHLDPFEVKKKGVRKSPSAGHESPTISYLNTSPEYNLKILLAHHRRSLFQIAHSFREGDTGDHHSEEFLMLEWYKTDSDEWELIGECHDLFKELSQEGYSLNRIMPDSSPHIINLREEMELKVGCNFQRSSLEDAIVKYGFLGKGERASNLRYEELFFSLFLNLIEPHLGKDGPVFVHGYPPELAANSTIENDIARRFEIYWKGIELANGYLEITDYDTQIRQFDRDNEERIQVGKEPASVDLQLEKAMKIGLPKCSGIALGLDRLLMVLRDESHLKKVSPFCFDPRTDV